jgi:signal transduction histidine kinase
MPDIKGLIGDTIAGSRMIKELVENLRNFSHLDRAKSELTDIHKGIESSIKILMPQFKHQLKIHKAFKAKGIIDCNPGQMNQVFLNILANAAQAIGREGNIWIETFDANDTLVIRIRDDGIGMTDEILAKIFDPFFTTKKVGEGTGLGLSISYSIIQNQGGRIEAESTPGKGTTFTLTLPYSQTVPPDTA